MNEIDVTLTDYLLAAETLYFFLQLRKIRPVSPLRFWSLTLFMSLTVSTVLGGTLHGFLPDPLSLSRQIVWALTMTLIGLAALAAWAIAALLLFPRRVSRWVTALAFLEFLAYAWIVCFVADDFLIAVINYSIPSVLLLFAFFKHLVQGRKGPFLSGAVGMGLTFVAAGVQVSQMELLGMSHNAAYHLIQGVGLAFVFITLRSLSLSAGSEISPAGDAAPQPTPSITPSQPV